MGELTKTCSKCRINKNQELFRRDSNRKDGLYPWCKSCEKSYRQSRDPSYSTSGRGKGYWLAKDGYKRCCKCKANKLTDEFYRNKSNPDGFHHYCKSCSKEAIAKSNKKHPESKKRRIRKNYLKRKYGLTPYQYELRFIQQEGKCAICEQEMNPAYVDHDRTCCPGNESCGKCVRALLCSNCNKGMGYFQGDINLLVAATNYLKYFKGRQK
jgi:hypothetical protein